jgi:hypothetical protein
MGNVNFKELAKQIRNEAKGTIRAMAPFLRQLDELDRPQVFQTIKRALIQENIPVHQVYQFLIELAHILAPERPFHHYSLFQHYVLSMKIRMCAIDLLAKSGDGREGWKAVIASPYSELTHMTLPGFLHRELTSLCPIMARREIFDRMQANLDALEREFSQKAVVDRFQECRDDYIEELTQHFPNNNELLLLDMHLRKFMEYGLAIQPLSRESETLIAIAIASFSELDADVPSTRAIQAKIEKYRPYQKILEDLVSEFTFSPRKVVDALRSLESRGTPISVDSIADCISPGAFVGNT